VNGEVSHQMHLLMEKFEADDDLWVGVVAARDNTPEKPVFCAGADLKAMSGRGGTWPKRPGNSGGFAGLVQRKRIKPMIAAVHGAALAGGCEIVLASDMVVASTNARFGVPEVKRSLIPAAGGNFRLMQKLPRSIALELILTGDPIPAEKAYELGLVNRLVQPGEELETAIELAKTITVNAPLAVREALRVAREGVSMEDDDAFKLSNERMGYLSTTPDFREGPLAFTEKRAPKWTGKPGDPARL
jgi:enoyl-CoA hydratase